MDVQTGLQWPYLASHILNCLQQELRVVHTEEQLACMLTDLKHSVYMSTTRKTD